MTKTAMTDPETCQHNDTREEKSGYGHTSTVTVCNDCGSDVPGASEDGSVGEGVIKDISE